MKEWDRLGLRDTPDSPEPFTAREINLIGAIIENKVPLLPDAAMSHQGSAQKGNTDENYINFGAGNAKTIIGEHF